ncbi:hypothetical protein C5L31_000989 [Secundilactobacillus malefermentans]|uniref:Uncharacterized protein n=1 Tax=Secundilactobacillus malefermentans TaxID=176292 RepID=A0A4R5NKE1_9LACO|nr:hypothetical protein C5L31_000989 [Secundilactobacillus malefermentans]
MKDGHTLPVLFIFNAEYPFIHELFEYYVNNL